MREMKEEIKNLFTRERILRLAAFSIDILVLALILSLCTLTLGKPNFAAARREMDAIVQITDFEARQAQTEVAVAAFSRAYNLSVAVWLGYEVLTQLALGGQTVGKKLCGLRIVSRRPSEGRLKTLSRLTLRTLVKGLCLILWGRPRSSEGNVRADPPLSLHRSQFNLKKAFHHEKKSSENCRHRWRQQLYA